VDIPAECKNKINNVKNRILFLSPSVLSGEERECRKEDFESLANSNIGTISNFIFRSGRLWKSIQSEA
jgi:hypothetical protein